MRIRSFLAWLTVLLDVASSNDVGQHYHIADQDAWESQYGSYPYRTFRTTDLISPVVRRSIESSQCYDDRNILLAPRGFRVPSPAVAMIDNQGELIWEHYVQGQAYNLNVQEYLGEKVITFWVGNDLVGGHGEGTFYVYNNKYEEITKVSDVGGLKPDLHEFTITSEGTALMIIYQAHVVKEPGIFRIKDTVWIWDCLVLEVDLETMDPIFQWRASDHHSLNETYHSIGVDGYTAEHPWDWYHANSIQKDELGNYLVSARYTSTVTYIDGLTGDITWILGGKRNSFQDLSNGHATNMAYQHIARFHNLAEFPVLLAAEVAAHGYKKDKDGVTKQLVAAFDNGADGEASDRPARGVLIEVSYPTPASVSHSSKFPFTARLVQSYDHPNKIVTLSQGSMQVVPTQKGSDPRILLGYGYVGVWTEYSAAGDVLCDNHFSTKKSWGQGHVQSYQVLKASWTGVPQTSPAVVLGSGLPSNLFVSWNGATEVREWAVQTPFGAAQWVNIAKVKNSGFETNIQYPTEGAVFLRVAALDQNLDVIGVSAIIDLRWRKRISDKFISAIKAVVTSPLKTAGFLVFLFIVVGLYKDAYKYRTRLKMALLGYDRIRSSDDPSKHV